jgi:hypothetical protein
MNRAFTALFIQWVHKHPETEPFIFLIAGLLFVGWVVQLIAQKLDSLKNANAS